MKIKGIIFDKDGTLLDFNKMWLGATKHVLAGFCDRNKIPVTEERMEGLLRLLGIENDCILQQGPLASMTYSQMGEVLATNLQGFSVSAKESGAQLVELYEEYFWKYELCCQPTCEVKEVLKKLRHKGMKLGLATADNKHVAEKCLDALGIKGFFDYLGCDDGATRPKPDPEMFVRFCSEMNLIPEEVAMVGDTVNDMHFAKNAGGLAVGVLCGLAGRKELEPVADVIIDNPEALLATF